MRLQEKNFVLLSEDVNTDPKQIRFKSDTDAIDVALLKNSKTIQETLPVGVQAISLSNIVQGRYLYVKPKNACVISIDGQTMSLLAGKASSIWATFTSLSITISGEPNDIVLVIAGE